MILNGKKEIYKRFMHGRRSFKEKDKRDIVNIQTATASFGYGSTTRKNIS